jgi:hypothetical protein
VQVWLFGFAFNRQKLEAVLTVFSKLGLRSSVLESLQRFPLEKRSLFSLIHVFFLRQQFGAARFYVGVVQFMASDVLQGLEA